jgi:hypothetical protein
MYHENQCIEILDEQICGICLEELEIETKNYKTICGHSFHHSCIHKSMKKSNNCPYCRKELQTPSACCVYEIINSIMFQSDYAYMLQTGFYAEIKDKDCYFTETEDSLYFIMYIFANEWESINYNRLLLSIFSYHNNIRFYPKKILKDYKQIAEDYDRWENVENIIYELDIDKNKIEYYSGGQRQPNSVLLMNKSFEWKLYEEEYKKEVEEYFHSNKN